MELSKEEIVCILKKYNLNRLKVKNSSHIVAKTLELKLDYIDECMKILDDRSAEILRLVYIKKLSKVDIAKALFISRPHLYRLIDKALQSIVDMIKDVNDIENECENEDKNLVLKSG